MNWITLLVAIGLGVLWIVGLAVGGQSAWFLWLVFAAAVILLASGAANLGLDRRRARSA
jgi:hypothetical protein